MDFGKYSLIELRKICNDALYISCRDRRGGLLTKPELIMLIKTKPFQIVHCTDEKNTNFKFVAKASEFLLKSATWNSMKLVDRINTIQRLTSHYIGSGIYGINPNSDYFKSRTVIPGSNCDFLFTLHNPLIVFKHMDEELELFLISLREIMLTKSYKDSYVLLCKITKTKFSDAGFTTFIDYINEYISTYVMNDDVDILPLITGFILQKYGYDGLFPLSESIYNGYSRGAIKWKIDIKNYVLIERNGTNLKKRTFIEGKEYISQLWRPTKASPRKVRRPLVLKSNLVRESKSKSKSEPKP